MLGLIFQHSCIKQLYLNCLFFRVSKFSLVKEHLVEFNQKAMALAEGNESMLNRVMTKDNIALAALLETKDACWENGLPSDQAQVNEEEPPLKPLLTVSFV